MRTILWMQHFRREESATTSVEYAVMLAMILLVLITGVASFGGAQNNMFGKVDNQMKAHGVN